MVAALNIKPETRAHVVENKHYSVLVAKLSYRLPLFVCGANVIVKIAVVVGLGYKRGYIALCFLPRLFERFHIKPRHNNVVCHVLGQYAGVVGFHSPRVVAVVVALEKYYLFSAGVGACTHYGECGGVCSVLHKISPVGAFHRINQQLCALHHFIRGRGSAVAAFKLLQSRRVNLGVVVAQHIRSVGAHKVKVTIAVHIPKICTLGF